MSLEAPAIEIHRDDAGTHWLATSGGLDLCSEWQPTPEAAVVDFMSRARQKWSELGRQTLRSSSPADDERYLQLTRWFA
jgi:hypothetical protein